MSKITIDEATVKLALEALEEPHPGVRTNFTDALEYRKKIKQAITAIKEALAEQPELWKPEDHYQDGWRDALQSVQKTLAQQEPVACVQDLDEVKRKHLVYEKGMDWKDPLYTSPPAQQCKWPTCQREDYQQALAEQIKRELVGEQPAKQEPVAWRYDLKRGGSFEGVSTEYSRVKLSIGENWIPLYTSTPQRTWVGLTDTERNSLWREIMGWGDPSHDDEDLMKAIEDASRRKNT